MVKQFFSSFIFSSIFLYSASFADTKTQEDASPFAQLLSQKALCHDSECTKHQEKIKDENGSVSQKPTLFSSYDQKALSQYRAIAESRAIQRATTYEVRGKRYTTIADSSGFIQTGRASWYGGRFHGRKTASGEVFNMNAMTAAHKNLPLGTKIEVTNNDNGKKVVVTVNDRGPFHGDRVLDLSRAAAEKLGVVREGVANVTIRAL